MATYIALLRKDKGSDYGVEFPDFPGCVTAGRTLDEACMAAQEALELHLHGMRDEGHEIPGPSSLEEIVAAEDMKGAVPFLVEPRELETKVVRVNVTFKPAILEALDDYAEANHLTRAAALEVAVKRTLTTKKALSARTGAVARKRRSGSGRRAAR
jgi:predicted RNase H-like HicB family nuclease